ncbi:hypothetical protein SSE37_21295 [Sagittula stellata E-37]|uniref:Uncharacterized protein n=1 Tax=Sagittula stellata (strain ATCC 700073 / DSM 11524 / E-37) TaxID=388399 RepID=A3K5I7_SAGS3|nr:hypothetical protein SSE37_21295 [Sagittula stellata E-37]
MFDGLFLFGDLACLDRQAQTTGLHVDVGDADVHLVTDRETLGALLGPVAGQVGTADEGLHAFVFHLDAAVLDGRHFDSHDGTALHAAGRLCELVATQRLDRERDTLFLDVDFGHHGLDDVALAVFLDGFFAALVPAEVGEVNHAVDLARQADEQTELGDVLDLALDLRALGVRFGEHFPRVAHGLLETQRHATLGRVDFQHHDIHFLRGGDDLAGVHVLLGPGHLGDVDQTFDTGFELNKCTVIGDVGHATFVHGAQRVLHADQIPRIFLQLLHAEGDTVGFLVDLDDLHFDSLTDRQDFRRMVHTAPCHVGDVQQAVNAAEIDECAVLGDVLDHAVNRIPFLQLADDLGALFGAGLFEDRAAGNNDIATATVHLEDLERLLETHERASVAHRAHVDLRAGQEGHGAAEVDGEAALDAAEDRAFDACVVCVCLLQAVPCFFATGHLAGDDGFATGVFGCAEEDLHFVADLNVRLLAGFSEFLQLDAAFHLVAYVDDGLARFDCDDLAFDNRTFVRGVHFEALIQERFEFFHGCVLSHVACVSFTSFYSGRAVVSAGLGWVGQFRHAAKQRGPVFPALLVLAAAIPALSTPARIAGGGRRVKAKACGGSPPDAGQRRSRACPSKPSLPPEEQETPKGGPGHQPGCDQPAPRLVHARDVGKVHAVDRGDQRRRQEQHRDHRQRAVGVRLLQADHPENHVRHMRHAPGQEIGMHHERADVAGVGLQNLLQPLPCLGRKVERKRGQCPLQRQQRQPVVGQLLAPPPDDSDHVFQQVLGFIALEQFAGRLVQFPPRALDQVGNTGDDLFDQAKEQVQVRGAPRAGGDGMVREGLERARPVVANGDHPLRRKHEGHRTETALAIPPGARKRDGQHLHIAKAIQPVGHLDLFHVRKGWHLEAECANPGRLFRGGRGEVDPPGPVERDIRLRRFQRGVFDKEST